MHSHRHRPPRAATTSPLPPSRPRRAASLAPVVSPRFATTRRCSAATCHTAITRPRVAAPYYPPLHLVDPLATDPLAPCCAAPCGPPLRCVPPRRALSRPMAPPRGALEPDGAMLLDVALCCAVPPRLDHCCRTLSRPLACPRRSLCSYACA
ncbi:hypothetical protein DENSPDRAFT_661707 [Dentipellis sp. KUC8613]|nr:hypothetical protein DENSPDRAFT_661707 [Dentipellis sp. KUC8613]